MTHIPIAIIGSGFSGLGLAIRLKQKGIDDFLIFERAQDLGGTWRDNTYPGCACDVESHLYSFSFAPNPEWSRLWSPQPEILEYLRGCAERFGVMPHLRLNHALESAAWDETNRRWNLSTSRGPFTADVLVSGMGALSEPFTPVLKGADTFRGKTFHSARWDHAYDLKDRRVAVIGTGASAAQFVPAIGPLVKSMHVFQRTPAWILSYYNRRLSEREHRIYRRFPILQKLQRLKIYVIRELTQLLFRYPKLMRKIVGRLAEHHLARKVKDPVLRAKLTPDYVIGCKRVLLSRDFYYALVKENVEVVTDEIREIRENGVVTKDGTLREVDTIIYGTGFALSEMHRARFITGRDGRSLSDVWEGSPKAYVGITVSGFPNLFLMLGPNTGLGHTSIVLMIEAQIAHIVKALEYMRANRVKALEPRPESQAAYVAMVDRKLRGTVWTSGHCLSWYLDKTGRASALWPTGIASYRRQARRFRSSAYVTSQ